MTTNNLGGSMNCLPRYKVLFWVSDSGKKPVADWLKALPKEDKMYLGGLLKDLAYDGPNSRPKVFKHIAGDLWEIRDLRKGAGFRIYFGFDGDTICIVLNSGNKSSQNRNIELAHERLKGLTDGF